MRKKTGLSFDQALKYMLKGHEVCRKGSPIYWQLSKGNPDCHFPAGIYATTPEGNIRTVCRITDDELYATDWEIKPNA